MEDQMIKQNENQFYIGDSAEKPLAYVHFFKSAESEITVDHTVVDPALEGQGIGGKLFDCIIAFAEREKLKIVPTCSFIRAKFSKKPNLAHLLSEHSGETETETE